MDRVDCWVCCQEMQYHAVGSCGHNDMCMRCALRLRILLKDFKCPICKAELDRVLITDNPNRTLEEYPRLTLIEAEHGFLFENREAVDIMQKLTTFSCWLRECQNLHNKSFTQANLKKHMDYAHKLRFCEICLKSRIVFLCEQKLYTAQELDKHIQNGDTDVPGHPMCLFCKTRFFDDQELRRHLQEKHFSCGICENSRMLFYENYEKLRQHFIKAHYFCQDAVCLQNRFVVFRSCMEFHHHNVTLHVDRTGMTKAQIDQLDKVPFEPERDEAPNTEAVDFTSVLQKGGEEEKRKERHDRGPSYVVRRRIPQVQDYRNVFPRTPGEMKGLLRDALNGDEAKLQRVLRASKDYNTSHTSAAQFVETFLDTMSSEQGEALFPVLISTLKNQSKQEELQGAYTRLMQARYNVTMDGRCSNELADCKNEGSVLKALQTILEREVERRRKETERRAFFVDPQLLIQMATIVDGLEDVQMARLAYVLNFGVKEETKQRVLTMIEKASDLSFCSRLTTKFDEYFLGPINPFEVYTLFKYVDMCVCKLKGLPFKNDTPAQKNLENEGQVGQPAEKPPEEGEGNKKWAESGRKKVPVISEEQFPTMMGPGNASPGARGTWGKGEPPGLKREEITIQQEEFPSLPPSFSHSRVSSAPAEETKRAEVPAPVGETKPLPAGLKQETRTKGKGKNKRSETVYRL